MLRIEHLTKRYGDKLAVDDLSLKIEPGEIYGFIGHNGAGKTTTLKSVVGILDFDEGESAYLNLEIISKFNIKAGLDLPLSAWEQIKQESRIQKNGGQTA